jgi:hypothetical protein
MPFWYASATVIHRRRPRKPPHPCPHQRRPAHRPFLPTSTPTAVPPSIHGNLLLNGDMELNATADDDPDHFVGHTDLDGSTPSDHASQVGYSTSSLAENIAQSSNAVPLWMNSSGHRQNLLTPGYRNEDTARTTTSTVTLTLPQWTMASLACSSIRCGVSLRVKIIGINEIYVPPLSQPSAQY